MKTEVLQVNRHHPERDIISKAADVIKAGGLVAFPTETVYGLGCDVFDVEALDNIFKAKGRPSDNPFIVHISDSNHIHMLAKDVPGVAEKLAAIFWPGPLTIIMKKKDCVPLKATGGMDTVAIRMPSHPVALNLIAASGTFIAAPSANISGLPSTTRFSHVQKDLLGKIEMILDGGPANIGVESTVIDVTTETPTIYRPGGVTKESIEALIGPVLDKDSSGDPSRSPGTRYKHYSPQAEVVLIEHDALDLTEKYFEPETGIKVGFIGYQLLRSLKKNSDITYRILKQDPQDYANNIFDLFRVFDEFGVNKIVIQGLSADGLGSAVMDRLRRSATVIVKHEKNGVCHE